MATSGFWSRERYFQHDVFVDLERDLFSHKASSFKLRSRTLCKSLLNTILCKREQNPATKILRSPFPALARHFPLLDRCWYQPQLAEEAL